MIDADKFSNIWEKIRDFWDKPRLNSPEFLDEKGAAEQGLSEEIAAIRMNDSQIFVNEKNLEQRVGNEHLPRVVSHEVGHYKKCPRTLRNFVKMVSHADLVTKNLKHAKLIQNLYSDLVVNTEDYKKGDKRMIDLYKRLSQGQESSELWQLYMSTYENMIQCPGKIIPPPKEEIRVKAKKLADIVSSAMDQSSKWPNSVKKFAKVVNDYIRKEEKQRKDDAQADSNQQNNPQSAPQSIPDIKKGLISDHKAQDFIPYDSKKIPQEVIDKHIEKELKGLSKELGNKEFKRVVSGLGLGSSTQANIWLYRELAAPYTLFLPQSPNTRAGEFKESPKKWNIGDPIDQLDYDYSYRQSPILIPGITTHKWQYKKGENYGLDKDKPDLLIVLDSSISMPNPKKCLSFPVISAKVAADSALAYGSKVAVINFSSRYKSCNFTNQTKDIDPLIVHYFRGGTEIPGEEMVRLTSNHIHPIHTMIISDTDIQNLDRQIYNLEKTLKNSKAGGSIFLACNPTNKTKKLQDMGYNICFARDFNDLGNLAISKSKEIYQSV